MSRLFMYRAAHRRHADWLPLALRAAVFRPVAEVEYRLENRTAQSAGLIRYGVADRFDRPGVDIAYFKPLRYTPAVHDEPSNNPIERGRNRLAVNTADNLALPDCSPYVENVADRSCAGGPQQALGAVP